MTGRSGAQRWLRLAVIVLVVGLVGITTGRAGAQQAARFLSALGRGAMGSGMVALGAPLGEVKERLAERYDATVRCTQAACLAGAAESLDADLLVSGQRQGRPVRA